MTNMEWPRVEVVIDGRTSVQDGFRALYFITAPHSSLAGPVAAALDYYSNIVGLPYLRFFVDDEGDTSPLTGAQISELLAARFSGEYESEGALTILSTELGVADAQFYYYGADLPDPLNPGLRNFLDLRFPATLAQELGADDVARVFVEIGRLLPISSAYASPALFYNQEITAAFKRTVRFPGFDILDPAAVCVDIDGLIPGVYWLSLLGQEVVASLGGSDVLRSQLPSSVTTVPAGQSLCIRLGPVPLVGDVNRRGQEMDLYRAVAHFLEPVLHEPEITYILDESGAPDREAQVRWYRRFLR